MGALIFKASTYIRTLQPEVSSIRGTNAEIQRMKVDVESGMQEVATGRGAGGTMDTCPLR